MRRANNRHRTKSPANTSAIPAEPVELQIDSLSHDGRGVGRYKGKATFVSHALPGETVLAQLHNTRAKFNEAHCSEVISGSEARQDTFCQHYQQCGGCDLQHLQQQTQIEHKQDQVLQQLSRIGNCQPDKILPALQGPDRHYRRSARIGINQRADGEIIVGFRRRHSNLLQQIDDCPVLDQRLENFCAELRDALQPLDAVKHLTHVDINLGDATSDSSNGLLSIRHKKPLTAEEIAIFSSVCQQFNLTLQHENSQAESASYSVSQLQLNFHSGDFIQVNASINQQMVSQALELLALESTDKVLDLFCGLGNFSLPMAQQAATVTGIEGSDAMVKQASNNAAQNQLQNCEFYKANLAEDIRPLSWYQQSYNKILLDPPRAGAENIIQAVCQLQAEKILYIACNPGALARDSAELLRQGYRLSKFMLADMFPQTHHVESVALFEPNPDFKPEQQEKLLGKNSHQRGDTHKNRKSSSKPVKQNFWRRR